MIPLGPTISTVCSLKKTVVVKHGEAKHYVCFLSSKANTPIVSLHHIICDMSYNLPIIKNV